MNFAQPHYNQTVKRLFIPSPRLTWYIFIFGFLYSCSKPAQNNEPPPPPPRKLPTIVTSPVTASAYKASIAGVQVVDKDPTIISEEGILWGLDTLPRFASAVKESVNLAV